MDIIYNIYNKKNYYKYCRPFFIITKYDFKNARDDILKIIFSILTLCCSPTSGPVNLAPRKPIILILSKTGNMTKPGPPTLGGDHPPKGGYPTGGYPPRGGWFTSLSKTD